MVKKVNPRKHLKATKKQILISIDQLIKQFELNKLQSLRGTSYTFCSSSSSDEGGGDW